MVAARLGIKVNLIGIVPATDNKPDGSAFNPGDILKMFNGLTVEIISTDAEGRLLLADALSYGITRCKPDLAIDLATLTGACVTALGHSVSGLVTNTDANVPLFVKAGNRTYERVWQLPLFSDYEKLIESRTADMKNTGGRPAAAAGPGRSGRPTR